jgi:hypothetical protein
MVYINKNSTIVTFPKVSDVRFDRLNFENQVTHIDFDLDINNITDGNLLYIIDITSIIDRFDVGQYNYWFMYRNEVVDSGILQFENFDSDNIQYDNKVEYIQYTPNK